MHKSTRVSALNHIPIHNLSTLDKKSEKKRGARGVMVIVAGNEHGNTNSNPGRD